jgi:putative hydrolase of the HAD superfamily
LPDIPWADIETVFLDAGNTLVSIDFGWVCDELARRGVEVDVDVLRRAEAAARPAVSHAVGERGRTEGGDSFLIYLCAVLSELGPAAHLDASGRDALARELAPVLRSGGSLRLWSWRMPTVETGLVALRDLGLRLVVVSNSDGTVDETLRRLDLAAHFDVVVDSHIVGFEKPDPRIFDHAVEESGADRRRTLHVGDLYSADVVGARQAGIHPILLDPYGDWPDVDCTRSPDVAGLAQRLAEARR